MDRRLAAALVTALLTGPLVNAAPAQAGPSLQAQAAGRATSSEPIAQTARYVVVQRSRVRLDIGRTAGVRRVRAVGDLPRHMALRTRVLSGWAPKGHTVVRLTAVSTVTGQKGRRVRLKVVVVGRPPVAVRGTSLVTRGPGGRPGNGPSYAPTVSADGSAVAFLSRATNLLASPLPPAPGLDARAFVWDRTTGRTELVSVAPDGTPLTGGVLGISDDGSRVLVRSGSNLLVRDRSAATTRAVAIDAQAASLSGDGNLVTYSKGGRTTRVTLASGASEDLGVASFTAVSPSGRYLAVRHGGTFYIWDAATRTVARELDVEEPEPWCTWAMTALTDDAQRATVFAGCDRAVGSSVVDTTSLSPLAAGSILEANAAATWVATATHRGVVAVSAVGGDARVLSQQPARVRTPGPIYGYSPSVSVAGEGDTVVWSVHGGNVVRNAYSESNQLYIWSSGR